MAQLNPFDLVVLLMLSVGFGLGAVLQRVPLLYTALETASVLYLLYLAWKIGTSGEVRVREGQPFGRA